MDLSRWLVDCTDNLSKTPDPKSPAFGGRCWMPLRLKSGDINHVAPATIANLPFRRNVRDGMFSLDLLITCELKQGNNFFCRRCKNYLWLPLVIKGRKGYACSPDHDSSIVRKYLRPFPPAHSTSTAMKACRDPTLNLACSKQARTDQNLLQMDLLVTHQATARVTPHNIISVTKHGGDKRPSNSTSRLLFSSELGNN